jgi:DNA/RNA endonuclease YhcR with UshA esterase domain
MKLKYFIPSLVAVVAAMFTGCSEDNDPTYLDGLRVSQSYVALPQNGGTQSITVNAAEGWSIDDATIPTWLTVSPKSGSAGESTISFSAASSDEAHNCELKLNSADKTQRINVLQYVEETDPVYLTVAEALAMIKAGTQGTKAYYVKGIVCKIQEISTSYGNATFWISDDGSYKGDVTNELEIYRGLWKNGAAYTSDDVFSVGDEIVIKGVLTEYKGTPETAEKNSEVISVKKSLVKIEEGAEASLDANGGDFTVRLSLAGDGPFINVAEDAAGWVGISSVVKTDSTVNVKIHVAANNDEKARTGHINFISTSGSVTSTVIATVSQMGLQGTLTNPFSVEDAIAYCQKIGGESGGEVYVKGKISKIEGEFGSYGNATFWISDDGVFNDDKSKDFECYRVLWLGNNNWADGNAQISVGDEVLICGKVTIYNGTAETASKKAYIYQINGVSDDTNGIGSLAAPFNIAGAISAIDNGWAGNVFVAGKISKIHVSKGVPQEFNAQYGNATFWISDDGNYNDDSTKDFEAYQVYYLGNRMWVEGDTQIAVGDELILHGQLTKYNTTYETAGKKAYIYSLNGVTE